MTDQTTIEDTNAGTSKIEVYLADMTGRYGRHTLPRATMERIKAGIQTHGIASTTTPPTADGLARPNDIFEPAASAEELTVTFQDLGIGKTAPYMYFSSIEDGGSTTSDWDNWRRRWAQVRGVRPAAERQLTVLSLEMINRVADGIRKFMVSNNPTNSETSNQEVEG